MNKDNGYFELPKGDTFLGGATPPGTPLNRGLARLQKVFYCN